MINVPSARTTVPAFGGAVPVREGSIHIDMTPWKPNPDLPPTAEHVHMDSDLAIGQDGRKVYVALSATPPVEWVMAGFAGFGLGPSGELVGILHTNLTIDQHQKTGLQ
jgi:hypothetical protein